MQYTVNLSLDSSAKLDPEVSFQQVVHRVLASGQITSAERLWLHRLLFTDFNFNAEMSLQIQSVLDRFRMGLIKVVD